jgi:hypothetical protein
LGLDMVPGISGAGRGLEGREVHLEHRWPRRPGDRRSGGGPVQRIELRRWTHRLRVSNFEQPTMEQRGIFACGGRYCVTLRDIQPVSVRLFSGWFVELRSAFPSSPILSERSSPSRVRYAAPNTGAPLTAPGRSGAHAEMRERRTMESLADSM